MKLSSIHTWMLVFTMTLLISGCQSETEIPSTSTNSPTVTYTTRPPTETPIPATPSASPIPPTETHTATLSPSPTIPPSDTPTATEEPPVATIYSSSVCRHGPGTAFTVHTSFEEDSSAFVRGRLEDDSWLVVELPGSGETCWIFNEIVDLNKEIVMMPIVTPPPLPTPAPVPTKTDEEKALGVKYFLIIPDNGGPFACGDGLVYFYSGKKGKGIEEDVTVALNALFSVKTQYINQYYNPVYQSSLRVKEVNLDNGHATIYLGGNFVKPKTECEAKRIHLQVWQTASQFSEIKVRPTIWVNDALLGDLLRAIQDNK